MIEIRNMIDDDAVSFEFDDKHRVLLVVVGKRLNRDIYLSLYAAIDRIVATRGPLSSILDLSSVLDFDVFGDFAREMAAMRPAIPPGMVCVVVAPQPVIYGTARIVETLRSTTAVPIKVVRSLDEAFASFGSIRFGFNPID